MLVTVPVPVPHAPPLVVIVERTSGTGGITRTSSTKSSLERYVWIAVEHNTPVVNKTVIVAWFVEVLNDPVRFAFCVMPAAVTVTVAAVGYVRQALGLPGEVGFDGFDDPDESEEPPHPAAAARDAMTSMGAIFIGPDPVTRA